MDDGFDVELFGRHQWEPSPKIKAHLVAKRTDRTGTCAVAFANTLIQNMAEEILISLQTFLI